MFHICSVLPFEAVRFGQQYGLKDKTDTMNKENEIVPVVVFTGTYWQAGMVKSMLEDAGIEVFLYGTAKALYNPGWTLPGEEGSVRVAIPSRELDRAKPILDSYLENQR
jgi:hypothetical protein